MMKYFLPFISLFISKLMKKNWLKGQSFMIMLFLLMMFYMGLEFLLSGVGLCEDMLSNLLILLSVWLSVLLLLSSSSLRYSFWSFNFILLCLFSCFLLFLVFLVDNIIWFYIFFELGALPTLLMIIRFGYQPERWRAGIYLILYTFFGSIPFFVSMVWWQINGVFISFNMMYFMNYSNFNMFFLISCTLAFMVKLPIFSFHIWLPKAHVEAPIAGSMLLAGVLLKLGGYGLIRFFSFYLSMMKLSTYFLSWGLMGGLLACMVTFRQSDMKCFIAYSSVCHMSLILAAMYTYNILGSQGSILMMISHGLISCGMFCLASLYYDRLMSRSVFVLGGISRSLIYGVMIWFLMLSLNMGLPPFFSFWSELNLFLSMVSYWSWGLWLLIMLSFQMAGVINLFYFLNITHGEMFAEKFNYEFKIREKVLLLMMVYPTIILSLICLLLV